MNGNNIVTRGRMTPDIRRAVVQRMVQVLAIVVLYGAILFLAAGRLGWGMGWIYLAIYVAVMVANMLLLLPNNPELIAERGQTKANTKGWDKTITIVAGVFLLGTLAVGGLDERLNWSAQMPLGVHLIGIVIGTAAYGLFAWAMASNAYFARVVRLQGDRGQQVATGGPYRVVRHPGYVGFILHTLATPLILGSVWAFIPAVGMAAAMIVRTALEDRALQDELVGYKAFAQRTRYRLLPGVW